MKSIVISIEGNIGTGKSTFITNLKSYFEKNNIENVIFLQEPVDEWLNIKDKEGNHIIEKFYADKKKYSFSFQMMAYISRLSNIKKILKEKQDVIIISERSLFTDKNVFAKMLYDDNQIEEIEYTIYNKWFNDFIDDIPFKSIIYLRTTPEICFERIKKRNRDGESDIPLDYLKSCHQYHENWINNESRNNQNVLFIECNDDITLNKDILSFWIDKSYNFIINS